MALCALFWECQRKRGGDARESVAAVGGKRPGSWK